MQNPLNLVYNKKTTNIILDTTSGANRKRDYVLYV